MVDHLIPAFYCDCCRHPQRLRYSCVRDRDLGPIHHGDYGVLQEIFRSSIRYAAIEVGNCNNERRVSKVGLRDSIIVSSIESLPPSIGRLKRLEDLDLGGTKNMFGVPEEIGELVRLKKLSFFNSGIKMLPRSIGCLNNLEELNLGATDNMFQVPEEIGNMTQLKRLAFYYSGIKSLPSSIGKLHQLEDLDLTSTKNLFEVPEEIGKLTQLKNLDFNCSSIEFLPPSIGHLQNLERLNLRGTCNLFKVPEEIGKLARLKYLSFEYSVVKFLPSSMGQLRRLEELDLGRTYHLKELPEAIGNLISLKRMNYRGSSIRTLSPTLLYKLAFSQGYQRALSKTGFGIEGYKSEPGKAFNPSLWPLLLNHARAAFSRNDLSDGEDENDSYSVQYMLRGYQISEPDAIHQLLKDGQESFFQLLVNRPASGVHPRVLDYQQSGVKRAVGQKRGRDGTAVPKT